MTHTPSPQPAPEPLYSLKQLHSEAETIVAGAYGASAVFGVLKRIRDDERAPLLARLKELEQIITDAKTRSLISSAPCPLCEYENGVLLKECQMHKEIWQLFGENNDAD